MIRAILASGLFATFLTLAASTALAQDIFVQIELDLDGIAGCSILRVSPTNQLVEYVSNAQVLAVTGETECDFDDTGLAVAPDGTVFFAEDTSHDILQVDAAGTVSVLVASETLDALIGTTADADNGMTVGSDGNLYVADEDCDCILQITPNGVATIAVTNAAILAATGKPEADLEGGLARGSDGTLYFVDEANAMRGTDADEQFDDEERGGGAPELVLSATPGGVVSVVTDEPTIIAATGGTSTDLDVDLDLGGGLIYLLDDGEDALVSVDPTTGAVNVIASEADVIAATGVVNMSGGGFDPEGGIAFDSTAGLIIGTDGFDENLGEDLPFLIQVAPSGGVSVRLTAGELDSFYSAIYGSMNTDFRYRGGLDVSRGAAVGVPLLSHGPLILLSLLVLGLGLLVLRRL